MKNKFKIGDRVKIKQASNLYNRSGELYIIEFYSSSLGEYASVGRNGVWLSYNYLNGLVLYNKWESICI